MCLWSLEAWSGYATWHWSLTRHGAVPLGLQHLVLKRLVHFDALQQRHLLRRVGLTIFGSSTTGFVDESCKFVEVKGKDADWELATDLDIFEFLDDLDESLDDYFIANFYGPDESPDSRCFQVRWDQPEIGVLACEVFEK